MADMGSVIHILWTSSCCLCSFQGVTAQAVQERLISEPQAAQLSRVQCVNSGLDTPFVSVEFDIGWCKQKESKGGVEGLACTVPSFTFSGMAGFTGQRALGVHASSFSRH
eukprot:9210925-Lingulodinium_polyedra.AAC.1